MLVITMISSVHNYRVLETVESHYHPSLVYSMLCYMYAISIFLNQARDLRLCLKLVWFVCRYACVCVSTPKGIYKNQWHDIGRVRLVKQVLQLSPTFNYFLTFTIDRMDGRGHINTVLARKDNRKDGTLHL